MGRILDYIKNKEFVISDGAWGTLLMDKGLKPGDCPDYLCITNKPAVEYIARAYIEAGSELIKTNSFGANKFKLMNYQLEDKCYEINKCAAEISKQAAGEAIPVMGSAGPTGKILMMGDVNEDEIHSAYLDQFRGLSDGGADAFILETFSDPDEIRIAVESAKEFSGKEIICTMTFEKSVNGTYHTIMGTTPENAAIFLAGLKCDIIGTNCGSGIQNMIEIVREMKKAVPNVPVVVHSNAGTPVYDSGKVKFPETPEFMASKVNELYEAGAKIIGGCCGTNPVYIAKMKKALDEFV